MEKHLAFASETLIKWLAEAVSSDVELGAYENTDSTYCKRNLGELLRKAAPPAPQLNDIAGFSLGSPTRKAAPPAPQLNDIVSFRLGSPTSGRQRKISATPSGIISGPRSGAPLKPSSPSFNIGTPTHDAQSLPYPRQHALTFPVISSVLHHVEASSRKCVLRYVFMAWLKVLEHSLLVQTMSLRSSTRSDSLTLQAILVEWWQNSKHQKIETELSVATHRAEIADKFVQRRSSALEAVATGAPFASSQRIATLRLTLDKWRTLTKDSKGRKKIQCANKQIEELSFALAAAQADREGKATHLVKICIVGAKGINGSEVHCVCEAPDRPRSRFETGRPLNSATASQIHDQFCSGLDTSMDVLWNLDRELFVADGEALQFTLLDREGVTQRTSSKDAPQSARAKGKFLGQATLRGFCLSGFDGEIDIMDAQQKKKGSLLVKVAVGVIHFRQPSASLAKDEMTAFAAANAVGLAEFEQQQRSYGAQSKRGNASQHQLDVLEHNAHAQECFAQLAHREEELCADWAVFYHSYSFAALIYELHAAVAAALFRFNSQQASLPRLLVHDFAETPDASSLIEKFNRDFAAKERDHHPDFRAVAISAMCSYVALGPEASPPVIFVMGYSQQDLEFRGVLEKSLASCFVPQAKIAKLAQDIIKLSEEHGLDVSQFGGKACESGRAGHLLQICVRRNLVDQLVFAAHPYGIVDEERHPISNWMNSNTAMNFGQARLVAHPKFFMNQDCVRMHVISADPQFHHRRRNYQEKLSALLEAVYDEPALRVAAAKGIYGGSPPIVDTVAEVHERKSCCKMQ